MKKMMAMVMALVLGVMLWGAAPAEEAAAVPEKNRFFTWIGQGVDLLTDAASNGWDYLSSAAQDGWDYVSGKVGGWIDRAEAYMKEKQWDVKVQEAWSTLKEGAGHQGEIAMETLTDAYHTVREWVLETGDSVDQHVAEAVDQVAGAADVAEAKLVSWYRRMEAYMAEKAGFVTESVQDAWTVIKQSAADAGAYTKEKVAEAYATVREWLCLTGETEDSELVQMLDEVSAQ